MSVTLAVHCDRCKAPVLRDRTRLLVACGDLYRVLPSCPEDGQKALDLCSSCSQALASWLQPPIPAAVAG